MNWKKKLKNQLKIKYIQLKARLPKLVWFLINILIVLVWALAIMLVLDLFLYTGIGILQGIQALALYFIIEQIKPWINKLTIYR